MSTFTANVGPHIVVQLRSRNRRCAMCALRRYYGALGMALDARFVTITRS